MYNLNSLSDIDLNKAIESQKRIIIPEGYVNSGLEILINEKEKRNDKRIACEKTESRFIQIGSNCFGLKKEFGGIY